jgi:hypothetical protein
MVIRNTGFLLKRKVSTFNKVRQYFNLVFKVKNLKLIYKLLAGSLKTTFKKKEHQILTIQQ